MDNKISLSIYYYNIFDFCIDDESVENCNFYIDSQVLINTLMILGMKQDKICKMSNEWLHLLNKNYYPSWINHYSRIAENACKIYNNSNSIHIDEDVISFVTAFSNGTVHGYAPLHYMINEYINKYKNTKIVVYKNSQRGILDIIYHYFKILYGESFMDYIILLDGDTYYNFKKMTFIPNKYHSYEPELQTIMEQLLNKYVYPFVKDEQYYKTLLNCNSIDNICILKTYNINNVTPQNALNIDEVSTFCNKNNYTLVEPSTLNEIDLIGILSYSKKFITMLTSCYHKNFIYLSDKCREVIIYCITDDTRNEYYNYKLQTSFKNAKYQYIVGTELK